MFRIAVAVFDLIAALAMCPSRRLTATARRYKRSVALVGLLLLLASLDRAFVLPRFDGWIGLVSLLSVTAIVLGMAWRWFVNEDLDVPARWRARASD